MATPATTSTKSFSPYGSKLTFKNLKNFVLTSFIVKQPIMIWGGPGVGKSSLVEYVQSILNGMLQPEERKYELIVLSLSQFEFGDLRGIPFVNKEGVMAFSKAPHLPTDPNSRGIIFIDELPNARKEVMTAAYQLINDGRIGDYFLPEGWYVMGAGNRLSDRGATVSIPAPLSNRFTHCEMDTDNLFEDWKDWALSASIDPSIVGFLSTFPEHLYKFSVESQAFPTPRSWSFLNKYVTQGVVVDEYATSFRGDGAPKLSDKEIAKRESIILDTAINGSIGQAVGNLYITYLNTYKNLPSQELILSGQSFNMNDDVSIIYGIGSMLSAYFRKGVVSKHKITNQEATGALNFIEKVIGFRRKDLAVVFLREFAISGGFNRIAIDATISTTTKNLFKTRKAELLSDI